MVKSSAAETHRVLDVFQGGGEGVYELMRQLRQEADCVHVQDRHVTRQLAGVNGDVQGGEELVPGLKAAVAGQRLDQSGFSWGRQTEEKVLSHLAAASDAGPTTAGSSHHSLCIPTRTRWETPFVCAELSAGGASSSAVPATSESSSLAPSAAAAGLRTESRLQGPTKRS